MDLTRLIGITFIVLIVLYFGSSLYIAYQMTEPNKIPLSISKEAVSENGESIEFKALDNVLLKGWFFPGKSKKVVIFVHGLGENRVNSYYGSVDIARFLLNENYGVFMYDTRGNGESEKVRLTYGFKDGNDIIGAINFLASRGYEKKNIAILGTSLGAISTLMVTDQIREIGGVILESPAAVLEPLTTRELTTTKKIPAFLVPGIYIMGEVFLGVDISSVRPIDKISSDPNRKFLFFHGEKDDFIPLKDGQELVKRSNRNSRLVIFKNAKHVETFKSNPELYKNEVLKYLSAELN